MDIIVLHPINHKLPVYINPREITHFIPSIDGTKIFFTNGLDVNVQETADKLAQRIIEKTNR